MEKVICYKVVREQPDGRITSAIISGEFSQIDYSIGKFVRTHPFLGKKGFHILVFDSFKNAKRFIGNLSIYKKGDTKIFSCECVNEVEILPKKCDVYDVNNVFSSESYLHPDDDVWPLGTRMFKKIKLIEEILDENTIR